MTEETTTVETSVTETAAPVEAVVENPTDVAAETQIQDSGDSNAGSAEDGSQTPSKYQQFTKWLRNEEGMLIRTAEEIEAWFDKEV